jgi:hypothetical protein
MQFGLYTKMVFACLDFKPPRRPRIRVPAGMSAAA